VLASANEIKQWGRERLTRRCDPRVLRLQKLLRSFPPADVVVFEDVEFSTYTKQTQLWASWRTTLWLTFGETGCVMDCVPVTTLKLFATGSGAADKGQMAAALYRQNPEWKNKGLDDNAVDAIFLWKWANHNLSRIAKSST
jgi:Holliday junction resolvasome RuvABC endonuclease subunit